jgi:glycosyltransferase involved in cell wall biosynthesis
LTARVTVIVPGKDAADFVADTLTSLTRQFDDPRSLDVVMVDDGSTDGTGDVVESFAPRLPGLRMLRNETAVGLASARNQGLAEATTPYVAYLDADDWLVPGHLATLVDAMDALRCNFLRVDHVTVTGTQRALRRAPEARRGVVLEPRVSVLPADDTTMVDYPYAWAGIFDRSLAEDDLLTFPAGLHTAEDRPWIWSLHLRARSYAVIDAPGICYRRGVSTSLTQVFDRRQLDVIEAFRQAHSVVNADRDAGAMMPKLIRMVLAILSHHMRRSQHMAASTRRELITGGQALLAEFPPGLLQREYAAQGEERRRLLRPMVPRRLRRPLPESTRLALGLAS